MTKDIMVGNSQVVLEERSKKLFEEHQQKIFKATDRLLGILMVLQWIGCIITALLVSPRTWIGDQYSVHLHVWAAILLGGAISLFPLLMIGVFPGRVMTRYIIAVSQMLMSALLIHLTGGRIETHFHVFGSLAILAFYRDWKVLIPATIVVALDHAIRGIFFPQSVFGVITASYWRWVEHAGWVVFEDAFLIVSCLRSVREMKDISLRRAQLENINEQIAAAVNYQTQELRKTRDQALAASKAKSEFLATMSHEIRTPMNAILGMGELLAESHLSSEQQEYVDALRRNGDHLLMLINDILDLSKVEVGKLQLERVPFDVYDVVERLTEMMAVRAHQKGLEMIHRIAPDVPRIIEGDSNRLRQVLMNLAGNALKFTERGEIVIKVSVRQHQKHLKPEVYELFFEVRDTGIGVPENKKDEIFGAFTQADSSTTRKYGGSGLGLSISKKLIEMMGGKIWLESEPGKGSRFYFSAVFQGSSETALGMQETRLNLKDKKILIVDDNATNRLVLREMMKITEAGIVEAIDGKSGLAKLRQEMFDLILLDCRMPEMDGFEFVMQMRQEQNLKSPAILMLTSDDRQGYVEKARELGIDLFLVKPVKKQQLFTAIHSAFGLMGMKPVQAPGGAAKISQEEAGRGLRILLVEDNMDNRLLIQSYLKKTGYQLDVAVNGLEAFQKIQINPYDLVLMDLYMPVMDGYEAAKKIREWEKHNNGKHESIPILALSASALQEEVSKSLESGCDQHLSKPIKKEMLLKVLQDYDEKRISKINAGKKAA